jgi:hypothetical protein
MIGSVAHAHFAARRLTRRRFLVGALALAAPLGATTPRSAAARVELFEIPAFWGTAELPEVRIFGGQLVVPGSRFFSWGYNLQGPINQYLRDLAPSRLDRIKRIMVTGKSVGANTFRISMDLSPFLCSRPWQLVGSGGPWTGVRRMIGAAEEVGVYLSLNGNNSWSPQHNPTWYDQTADHWRRWDLQARFWRRLAAIGVNTPAVMSYELMSEPIIGKSFRWYTGQYAGYYFVQFLAIDPDEPEQELVQAWGRMLRDAVREEDPTTPITVGQMPVTSGPLGPMSIGSFVDLLTVHCYPSDPAVADSVNAFNAFALAGKPMILGETYPLVCSVATERRFLRAIRDNADGMHYFFDGRLPSAYPRGPVRAGQQMFIDLRREWDAHLFS